MREISVAEQRYKVVLALIADGRTVKEAAIRAVATPAMSSGLGERQNR
jgi:hypothetical protein